MAIAKKKKRRLTYNDNLYYWFVGEDDCSHPFSLILSDDKKIKIRCRLYPETLTMLHQTPSLHLNIPFKIAAFTPDVVKKTIHFYGDYQQLH